MQKQITLAIMTALVLSIGAIMTTIPAQALECTEVAGGQISCLLDSGTITVEKLQDSSVSVEEKPNQVVVSVGAAPVAGNETIVEEPVPIPFPVPDPNDEPVDEGGGVFPGPEDPDTGVPQESTDEQMIVP